jgi:cell division protein FtsA
VLHANPALYTIDEVQGVRNPIGMHASRLGVDIHVIAADEAPLRNVDLTIRQAHLGVRAIVASPVAAGLAVLSQEERDLGVALVELGAEVTNVSLHAGACWSGCAPFRWVPRTSPTTWPPPSASAAAMPSGSNAFTARP